MNYLGKRYLYNLVKDKLSGIDLYIPPLKDLSYIKYKGDEILNCEIFDLFCVQNRSIYLSIFNFNSLDNRYKSLRICFYKDNSGNWIKTFERRRNE